MTMRVIVVGGGVTGLIATRRLRELGVAVTLIDRTFPFDQAREALASMQEASHFGKIVLVG